jgi:cell division protein DivIC
VAKYNKVSRINEPYIEEQNVSHRRQVAKKKRLVRRLFLFALVAITITVFITIYHINQRITHKEMVEQYDQKTEQLVQLQTEEKQLIEEINLLNDEEYLLQLAKTNYFFTEEGEIVFKLPEDNASY